MKRNDYEKPATKVVKLEWQAHIMEGSPTPSQGDLGDPQDPEELDWD